MLTRLCQATKGALYDPSLKVYCSIQHTYELYLMLLFMFLPVISIQVGVRGSAACAPVAMCGCGLWINRRSNTGARQLKITDSTVWVLT